MAELWFQALTDSPEDRALLEQDYQRKSVRVFLDYNQYLVNLSPTSAQARLDLGKALLMMERYAEAVTHFRRAAELELSWDEPHYFLGLIHRIQNRHQEAKAEFSRALDLNLRNLKAHENLGFIFLEESDLDRAENPFKRALDVDPSDALTREGLDMVRKARGSIEE